MDTHTFDHSSYHKNIKLLLDIARDEYKRHFIEFPAIQERTIKTYLWISSALIGLQVALIKGLSSPPFSSTFWASISIILAFISFCLGIDSLRSRALSVFGIKSYSDELNKIYEWAFNSDSDRKLNISLVKFFETAINSEKRMNAWRAKRQRIMSFLLLFSGMSIAMSVICSYLG